MNKEFIPYEQALALKELGFDEECFGRYVNRKLGWYTVYSFDDDEMVVNTPLYQQAFRWFRDKYQLHPEIVVQLGFKHWNVNVLPNGGWLKGTTPTGFNTYEEAELACLKKLIEIVKEK
jgi:hypothetical protein